jgi:Fic family protein
MEKLLQNNIVSGTNNLEDIALFHCEFKTIHSFRGGNWCVGRIIMFKQCIGK